jgi:hypothetical protein
VRDAVINYAEANTPIAPVVEGRVVFAELNPQIYLPLVFK